MDMMQFLQRRLARILTAFGRGNTFARRLELAYARRFLEERSNWITISDFDGNLRMKIDRSEHMGSAIYWRGYYSLHELRYLNTLLTPESVFVDAGANQGEFTLFAAKRVTRGTVLSFEPLPELFERLATNVRLNALNNVTLHSLGLSHRSCDAPIFSQSQSTEAGKRHLGLPSLYVSEERCEKLGTIHLEPLDEVFPRTGLQRLDVMKIDVEGAELSVLKGAQKTIQKYKPVLMMEMNRDTSQAAGYEPEHVSELLSAWGYELKRIAHRGKLQPAPQPWPKFCNVACIPASRVSRAA